MCKGFLFFRSNSASQDKEQGGIHYDPAGCRNIFTKEKNIYPLNQKTYQNEKILSFY